MVYKVYYSPLRPDVYQYVCTKTLEDAQLYFKTTNVFECDSDHLEQTLTTEYGMMQVKDFLIPLEGF